MKLVSCRATFYFAGSSIYVSCLGNILYNANHHNCQHLGAPAHIAAHCGGSVVGACRDTGCGYESTQTSSRFMFTISIRYESAQPYFFPSLNFSRSLEKRSAKPRSASGMGCYRIYLITCALQTLLYSLMS
jgi:hypothetical protein